MTSKTILFKLSIAALFAFSACSESNGSSDVLPGNQPGNESSSSTLSLSSGSDIPGNSSTTNNGNSSSGTSNPNSSSSKYEPSVDTDKFANITKPCSTMPEPISGGQEGHGSRYWDCCKPSCSWRENVDTTAVPFTICKNCSFDDEEIEAFEWAPTSNQYWEGYEGVKSGCETGGTSYTCNSQAPYAVCEDLAYAYVAVPSADGGCGKCFQFDFDGGGHYGDKAAHKLLKGKTMIVMASNIGPDVAAGQFDIMIPGGGVGIHNGCSAQWEVSNAQLGEQYGGFLTACQKEINDYDADPELFKDCVRKRCDSVLGNSPKLADAWQGCYFFVDWMHAADNPTFTYKEVECPQALVDGYGSSLHPTKDLPKTW